MPKQPIRNPLDQAVADHKAGRLDKARSGYALALLAGRNTSQIHRLIGVSWQQQGALDKAIAAFRQAVSIERGNHEAWRNLGVALREAGQHEDGLVALREAIARRPDYAEAWRNLGNAFDALERREEAEQAFRKAIALKPLYAEAHSNLGALLDRAERSPEAIEALREAVRLKPALASAHNNLGLALRRSGEYETSLRALRKALTLRPDYPEALSNMGVAAAALGRRDEALRDLRKAVRLKPKSAEIQRNLGIVYQGYGLFEEALAVHRRIAELDPRADTPYFNMAGIFAAQGRDDEAIGAFREAVAARPGDSNAHLALAMFLMARERYAEGFGEYEGRRKAADYPQRQLTGPEWMGEGLAGRRLHLYHEQGLGDALQFIRFARLVASTATSVSVEVHRPLVGLLRRSLPELTIVPEGGEPPPFDCHAPLMSVPAKLGLDLGGIAGEPYLVGDPALRARWAQRLPQAPFRIGIVWQGNPHGLVDRGRSFPLASFRPLAGIAGVGLVSLQKNFGLDQLATLPEDMAVTVLPDDFDSGPDAFFDTIGVMENLDLVITSDTSVAHIAGALGVPGFVILKHDADWRWGLRRETTPWYGSLTLLRQRQPGDWSGPFAEAAERVAAMIAANREVRR